jgi:hypothetical protein
MSENDSSPAFEACIKRKLLPNGTHEIHCNLGLWSVAGRDRGQVESMARHYWIQYATAGEYRKSARIEATP